MLTPSDLHRNRKSNPSNLLPSNQTSMTDFFKASKSALMSCLTACTSKGSRRQSGDDNRCRATGQKQPWQPLTRNARPTQIWEVVLRQHPPHRPRCRLDDSRKPTASRSAGLGWWLASDRSRLSSLWRRRSGLSILPW